jgi:hypothetical protein
MEQAHRRVLRLTGIGEADFGVDHGAQLVLAQLDDVSVFNADEGSLGA